jgi:enoyl-[acyl-carrier protein] reductase I
VDFLQLQNETIVVFGVANKKSVAYAIGQVLEQAGARVIYVVRSPARRDSVSKLLPGRDILVCDVEREDEIASVRDEVAQRVPQIAGLVHSIAFADYRDGIKPFHETGKAQFLQSVDISCYSFIAISNAFRELLKPTASVVAISISTTTMASENYGFMAPIKAALDSSLVFLCKSFSRFSEVRFNAVGAGLLKTSASAGIPGYIDSYLYAESVIPRKRGVSTAEVANVACFLLSPRSSGIVGQRIVVDAAMAINYFDQDLVRRASAGD